MADGFVQVPPDQSGKLIDTSQIVDGSGLTVQRQRVAIGDQFTANSLAAVMVPPLTGTEYGLVTLDPATQALQRNMEVTTRILGALRRIELILAQAFNVDATGSDESDFN